MDRFSLTPALDTPARAVCAGFWHLAQKDAQRAAQAFAVVRDLPGGEACYRLARALALAQRCSSFGDLAALGVDESFLTATQPSDGDPLAQRASWPALARLQRAAQEAHTVQMSVSRVVRSQALNRALAEVNEVLTGIEQIPRAERELVRAIATTWRDLLLNTTAEVGQATPTQPVRNPYIIGDPVPGNRLVGRDDVLRRLEELWYGSANLPSVVIFGHRRMGKTSILRNLDGRLGSRVHVAYVNLLLLGDLRNGAVDLFLKLADSIADTLQHRQLPAPPIDDAAFEQRPELAFERYLKQVSAILNEQRLIIALDEFEQLEEWITNDRLPTDILKTLRGYIQMDERIAFAFAGLHTLEEMSSDYFQPFFASVIPVKVSFLSRGAVDQVLANPPDPEFALDYEREALDDIYALTNGQPYLVQLIGHRLVSRFNTLSFEQGKAQEPRFRRADVEAVITTDFYHQARYYFTGVWGQAQHGAPEQQTILRCLAPHPDGLPFARLCEISGLPDGTVDQALQTLCRHDVVHNHDGQWRYNVELFRRWVEMGGGGKGT
jgi:Archaeal ATPase.